ncbi:MAG: exosortase B [Rhodocyclaceae bacterium]|nr:exosortase B [Rhodocyclaceae bacterium]
MTTATHAQTTPATTRAELAPWLIVLAGLLVMFAPTVSDLLNTIWADDEQAHGPIILAVSLWLLYRTGPAVVRAPGAPAPVAGALLLTLALVSYVVGRSQAIIQLEIGALIPALMAALLIQSGPAALKRAWFPLFFLIFMIPLPGVFVQTVTIPLKMGASWVAEHILYAAGYPIARTGVILQVGQYQLLVADACAGLHTMFTLEALGLLYMNIVGHSNVRRNILLALLILPISFAANVIRVVALILITYHLGDEAGQGFLHGFAGMVLFLTALVLILLIDGLLGRIPALRERSSG